MKKIMGGCTPGATIVGTSGGGVPGACRVDVMLCDQSCHCETKCDIEQSDEFCPS